MDSKAVVIVWNPLDKVAGILVLNVEHLLVNILHRHLPTEHSGNGEISAMSRITGCHHILRVEELLGQLWNSERTVLGGSTSGQRRKAGHKEMKSRKRDLGASFVTI